MAIARALISNPRILLLAEATSALDNTSERIVQDALDKAKEGRTTIVIAHRSSTIRNADLIIGIQNGQVVEYGIHEDLIEQKGIYYQLVTTQNRKEKAEEEEEELILDNTEIPLETGSSIFDSEKNAGENEKPSFDDTSKKYHGSLTWKILKLNSPEWFWILLGSISSLLVGATQPLFALFLTRIFALFAEPNLDEQKRLTNIYAIAIFLTGLVGAAAHFFIGVTFAKFGEELTMRMRKLTFSAILRQEIGYFDSETNSVGALITRLSSDTSSLQGMTGVRIGIMLQALSATITALAIAFPAGWKLILVIICFIPLMLLTGIFQGRKQSNIAKAKNKSSLTEQGGQVERQINMLS